MHYGLPIVTIVHIEPNMAHAHLSQVWRNVHYGLSIVTIVLTEPNMAHFWGAHCAECGDSAHCAIADTFWPSLMCHFWLPNIPGAVELHAACTFPSWPKDLSIIIVCTYTPHESRDELDYVIYLQNNLYTWECIDYLFLT